MFIIITKDMAPPVEQVKTHLTLRVTLLNGISQSMIALGVMMPLFIISFIGNKRFNKLG